MRKEKRGRPESGRKTLKKAVSFNKELLFEIEEFAIEESRNFSSAVSALCMKALDFKFNK